MKFYVVCKSDPSLAIDRDGTKISMRGFVPSFEIDEAVKIAEKFCGEVV